jgi:acetoacetate decarboxylase
LGLSAKTRQAAPGLESDTLVGTLDYGPARIATGSMGYKHKSVVREAVLHGLGEPGYLLKIIPHVDGTARICELVRYRFGNIELNGAWSGPAALELHPHALAPLTDLPVLEVISGIHLIADLTLNLGEVVHDYLAN